MLPLISGGGMMTPWGAFLSSLTSAVPVVLSAVIMAELEKTVKVRHHVQPI